MPYFRYWFSAAIFSCVMWARAAMGCACDPSDPASVSACLGTALEGRMEAPSAKDFSNFASVEERAELCRLIVSKETMLTDLRQGQRRAAERRLSFDSLGGVPGRETAFPQRIFS